MSIAAPAQTEKANAMMKPVTYSRAVVGRRTMKAIQAMDGMAATAS